MWSNFRVLFTLVYMRLFIGLDSYLYKCIDVALHHIGSM